jgi:ribosomal protein S18 acetylase RimI-like enzyme
VNSPNRYNIFLVAEEENTPVGYAQLVLDSKEEFIKRRKAMEIRRIYASSSHIGKGVGRELMQTSLAEARQRGCDCVWLGVWEKNPRAIDFYKRWGFVEVGTHIFTVGDDPQTDFIMELTL